MYKAIVLAALCSSSCMDAQRANIFSMGSSHTIECFSGGKSVFTAKSTGKVASHEGGSYSFEDATTKSYVTVTMDCVITVPR